MLPSRLKYDFFWAILALCLTTWTYGQQHTYRQYTIKDGLPSNSVYDLLQDQQGYLWLATDAGVSRFDGKNFVNFTETDGLHEHSIYELLEDNKGRIWMWGFAPKLTYYYQNELHTIDSLPYIDQQINTIYNDSQDNLWISARNKITLRLTEGLELDHVFEMDTYEWTEYNNNIISHYDGYVITIESDSITLFRTLDENSSNYHFFNWGSEVLSYSRITGAVYSFKYPNTSAKLFFLQDYFGKSLRYYVYSTSDTEIWVVTDEPGIYLNISNDIDFSDTCHLLPTLNIRKVIQDREGVYWFSTEDKGIIAMPSKEVFNMTTSNGLLGNNPTSICQDSQDNIVIGLADGTIQVNPKGKKHYIVNLNLQSKTDIQNLSLGPDQNFYFNTIDHVFVLNKQLQIKSKIPDIVPSTKTYFVHPTKGLWIGNHNHFYQYSQELYEKPLRLINSNDSYLEKRTAAIHFQNDTVWVGTDLGLYQINIIDTTTIYWADRHPALQTQINDIDTIGQHVWIATNGKGLVALNRKKNIIHHYNTNNHFLAGDICTSIFTDTLRQSLWVSTNLGISKVEKFDDLNNLTITSYNETDGLLSNEIQDILVDQSGKIWICSNEGISYFNESKIQTDSLAPPIYLTGFKIWKKDTLIRASYQLPYTDNDVTFEFTGISLKSPIKYSYQLEGWDANWQETDANTIRYTKLPPNDYTFKVNAINGDHIQSHQQATMQLTILPPFWQTWWFRLSAFVLVTSLIGGAVYYRLYKIQQENERQKQLANLELSGLRSQMNSHFLFNSLNAIQNFITQQDADSAHLYLSKFAKLIRQTLQKSKDDTITIHEEVNGLRLYMDLEALRIQHQFTYTLEVDEHIDQLATKIPPMLVQPYIENSIRHGLRHLDKNGKLLVSFSLRNNKIECIVEDNGIGREKANAIKNRSLATHKSMGTKITSDRIKLLNQVTHEDINVQIIDLYNPQGEAAGTRVILSLPLIF